MRTIIMRIIAMMITRLLTSVCSFDSDLFYLWPSSSSSSLLSVHALDAVSIPSKGELLPMSRSCRTTSRLSKHLLLMSCRARSLEQSQSPTSTTSLTDSIYKTNNEIHTFSSNSCFSPVLLIFWYSFLDFSLLS